MTIEEWEKELQSICAINGWEIVLRCRGLWIIEIYDKETGEYLASTGSTGIISLPEILRMSLDKTPWV